MLHNFMLKNEKRILALTEAKTLELAGDHPTSDHLKQGLPIFYRQVIKVIRPSKASSRPPPKHFLAIAKAADKDDEPAMAEAANQPLEAKLAKSAGEHGLELLRLGYTVSHVVHAYGALCQAITEVAAEEKFNISPAE